MKTEIQKCSFKRVLPDRIVKVKHVTIPTIKAVKIKQSKGGHAETDK